MARVLLLCTGNICRSPIAEGFLRQMLADRGIGGVEVESAGVSGLDGYPAMPEAVTALIERHVDISPHLARRLERRMAESADLVVTMSSSHREALVRMAPAAAGRTFTLKELVHLLGQREDASPRGGPGDRIGAAAAAADNLRRAGAADDLVDEDIPDPLGLGQEAFRAVAWQIEVLTERLVEELFGPAEDGSASGPAGVVTKESGLR